MGVEAIGNIFKIPDLKRRVLFTLGLLVVLQLGNHVPTPGVDGFAVQEYMNQSAGGGNQLFQLANMFTGGAFAQMSVFSLGVMPYITASIILQLLTVVVPALEKLSKEGQEGRKKMEEYTRYGTVAITLIQSLMLSRYILSQSINGQPLVPDAATFLGIPGFGFSLMTALAMTTGTMFMMYMGEQITEKGIGNGISLIIFANIISSLPGVLAMAFAFVFQGTGEMSLWTLLWLFFMLIVVIAGVVVLTQATRRITIRTGRQIVGRRQAVSRMSYLPLRLNTAGVIPIIFASSILIFPSMIFGVTDRVIPADADWMLQIVDFIQAQLMPGTIFYMFVYAVLIIFFCFFYTAVMFNPKDTADNLKKYGSAIPGYSPGKKTEERIDYVLTRITTAGAIFLTVIALVPEVVSVAMDVPRSISGFLGGTSLIIIVGVALDTVSQLENHLRVRNYDTFLKGGKKMKGGRSR